MIHVIDAKQTTLDICDRFIDILKTCIEDETVEIDIHYENFIHISDRTFVIHPRISVTFLDHFPLSV